jgi:CBS domain-containing protein
MDRSRLERFLSTPLAEFPLATPAYVLPSDTVRTAVNLMHEGRHSCVLSRTNGELDGIFTERDVLTKCMDEEFDWDQPLYDSVLTSEPTTISADKSVADAMAIMQRRGYRTLPVLAENEVLGLLILGDILRSMAEEFPEEILNLPPRPHQVVAKREGG